MSRCCSSSRHPCRSVCCIPGPVGPTGSQGPQGPTGVGAAIGLTSEQTTNTVFTTTFVPIPSTNPPGTATLTLPAGHWAVWFSGNVVVSSDTGIDDQLAYRMESPLNNYVLGSGRLFNFGPSLPFEGLLGDQALITGPAVVVMTAAASDATVTAAFGPWNFSAIQYAP